MEGEVKGEDAEWHLRSHSPTALRGRRSRGTVSLGVWLRVSLEGLTKGPHTLSGSGIWTSTRKLFYLQHPGDTRSWLGPRPHPLWGALLGREKGGGTWEQGSLSLLPSLISLSGPLATSPCPSPLCGHIWDKNSHL